MEKQALFDYIRAGGKPAPASVSQPFFELFFNGCSPDDIHTINPSFNAQAIQYLRVLHKWDDTVSMTVMRNNMLLVGKVQKAQTDAASLMSDMIAVATKQSQIKLRKYLQTGNADELKGAMVADNPERFMKVVESLIKLVYREEQTLSIKIPAGNVSQSVKKSVKTITTTAVSLIEDIAKVKRESARAKVLNQFQDDSNGQEEDK